MLSGGCGVRHPVVCVTPANGMLDHPLLTCTVHRLLGSHAFQVFKPQRFSASNRMFFAFWLNGLVGESTLRSIWAPSFRGFHW